MIATLALATAAGLEVEITVELANLAAGIVVSKVGTVPVIRDELLMSLMPQIELQPQEKVLSLDSLRARTAAWRSIGQSVVLYERLLRSVSHRARHAARTGGREGHGKVVGVNSDASVRALKGPTRPRMR